MKMRAMVFVLLAFLLGGAAAVLAADGDTTLVKIEQIRRTVEEARFAIRKKAPADEVDKKLTDVEQQLAQLPKPEGKTMQAEIEQLKLELADLRKIVPKKEVETHRDFKFKLRL